MERWRWIAIHILCPVKIDRLEQVLFISSQLLTRLKLSYNLSLAIAQYKFVFILLAHCIRVHQLHCCSITEAVEFIGTTKLTVNTPHKTITSL